MIKKNKIDWGNNVEKFCFSVYERYLVINRDVMF